jgi:hypothetical protein
MTLPNLMEALIAYGKAHDAVPLNKFPRCWEAQIDEHWWIAANAHRYAIECSHGPIVEPFHFYIEFNGFPAGVIDASGRGLFAEGEAANLQTFAEALQKAA